MPPAPKRIFEVLRLDSTSGKNLLYSHLPNNFVLFFNGPPLSVTFLSAPSQMVTWNKSNGFEKRSTLACQVTCSDERTNYFAVLLGAAFRVWSTLDGPAMKSATLSGTLLFQKLHCQEGHSENKLYFWTSIFEHQVVFFPFSELCCCVCLYIDACVITL